jgi:response regulator of citrate/malate metabolism
LDTATPVANGSVPATTAHSSTLDEIKSRARQEMEQLLTPLTARREQLEAELRDVTGEISEIQATVAALTGAPPVPQRKPKTKGQHEPSQKVLDDVYAIIARASDDMTAGEVSEAAQLSRSTVMRCIQILRETERIRLVGTRKEAGDERVGGRGANAYKVMM